MSVAHYPELLPAWRRLDLLLGCEILRLRARYQLSLDEFRGLYISDEQVDRLVSTARETAEEELPVVLPVFLEDGSLLARLGAKLGLGSLELELVLLALAPEVDVKYETLFAYLNDDVTRRWPTADLALRVLQGAEGFSAAALLVALSTDAPLARLGVVQLIEPPTGHPSLRNTGYKLGRSVVHYLLGLDALPPELTGFARRVSTGLPRLNPSCVRVIQKTPSLFRNRTAEDLPVVVLLGPVGRGAEALAAATAHELELELLCVDLDAARGRPGWPEQHAAALALHSRLHGAVILAEVDEALERPREVLTVLRSLRATQAPVLLSCRAGSDWREVLRGVRTVTIDIAASDFVERYELWDKALAAAGVDASKDTRTALAARFALSPQQVDLAVGGAVDLAALATDTSHDVEALLFESARRVLDQRLGKLASKVSLSPTWDDLVLPGPTRARLRDLASAVKCQHLVYDKWGFGRRGTAGTGIKALFAGLSGTGKTMTAAVLANELGFDLFRIDLSGIVSKYIGETEKNLDEIFRAARAGQAMLFFDEADALFGKRSEVKDAHERYANIEVAYLLQKLEQHDGVVILATNLRRNIDDAFSRRLNYVIDFPLPDLFAREALWRSMFPAEVPLGPDVDCSFLARQFALSGGDIRNVALDAAFLAAQNGCVITMKELVRATARQLTKQGRMPSRGDFQQYHALIGEANAS